MVQEIKFGTDGWRGHVGENYTFANVRRCTQGFASYLEAEGFKGEWVVTADQMSRDEEGRFWYYGRTDDLLKVAGQWVAPLEIELCLYRHPAVLEVCVVGASDQSGLVKPKAVVALKDGFTASDEMTGDIQGFVKEKRVNYLESEIEKKERLITDMLCGIERFDFGIELVKDEIDQIKKEKKKLENELKFKYAIKNEDINDEMIASAKEYPIDRLIEVNSKGFAVCPFHDDHNPSAYCKNNFLHCFTCGASADSISLYMHLHNATFKEAVLKLK